MAIVKLNKKHKKKDGWGFLLRDSEGNTYSMLYSQRQIQVPDRIAKDFEARKDLDIEYDNTGEEKDTKKVEKLLTEEQMWDLNKPEQVKILKKIGMKKTPRYEKGRVKKLKENIKEASRIYFNNKDEFLDDD